MSPSKILFYLCISFVAGIFLQSVVKIPHILIWGFLFLSILLIFIHITLLIRSQVQGISFVVSFFCVMFLILGVLRMQIAEFNISNDELSKLNGQEVVLTGVVSGEPDVRDTYQKLKVKVENSIILVNASKYPEYRYLDKIKITGKLEAPFETEDFSYKNYLMKDGIYSVISFPQIEKLDRHRVSIFSGFYAGILQLKQKIRENIRRNFLPPQCSILEGTILGDNGAMDNDLKNKLNITGLRHVIAVSGTHVVILSSIIMSFLLALGLWRGQAFYIAIIFLCLYIVFTGLPSSGIRAGVMGGLYLLAQKLGRQSMGSRVIAIACAVMLLINPLLLLYDVGFQLSFLAVMGLIYLEPFIKRFVKISIVSTTLAAQVFTLPIMVFNFGNISFVAPLTNLLILPIVSELMGFGFLASFAGVFSAGLAKVLFLPCQFLLLYFTAVIDIFSQPWAIKTIENVHWLWLAISYLLLVIFIKYIQKKASVS